MGKIVLSVLLVCGFLLSGCATAPSGASFTPLYMAAIGGNDIDEVSRLIDAGANVDELQMANFTPLRGAAQLGHIKIAKLLIRKGANVNSRAVDNSTPLMAAAQSGHTEMYNLLIANGADASVRDVGGRTAQDWAQAGTVLRQSAVVAPKVNVAALPLPNTINPSTPISGNSGKYMSPFTASGTVALWAQKHVATTDNGSDIAGAVGSYAAEQVANKALDFVPFGLGGMFARKAGDVAGRAVTSKTIEPALPTQSEAMASSDISFDSVDELAIYMYSKHSTHPEYARVLALTEQIYPELRNSYRAAIENASQAKHPKKEAKHPKKEAKNAGQRIEELKVLKDKGYISESEYNFN